MRKELHRDMMFKLDRVISEDVTFLIPVCMTPDQEYTDLCRLLRSTHEHTRDQLQ